ncbi:MAG: substrate-binding domain-containing protein [Bacteroidetes bacterium]|nr:substrate-binding domain-containing protein [Bacteroidota bacterium]
MIDRFVPGQEDTPFVTADNYGGSISVVDHLIKQGITRIGQLTISPSHLTSITERTRGYRDALAKHGIAFDPDLVREIPYDNIREGIRKQVPALINAPTRLTGYLSSTITLPLPPSNVSKTWACASRKTSVWCVLMTSTCSSFAIPRLPQWRKTLKVWARMPSPSCSTKWNMGLMQRFPTMFSCRPT